MKCESDPPSCVETNNAVNLDKILLREPQLLVFPQVVEDVVSLVSLVYFDNEHLLR